MATLSDARRAMNVRLNEYQKIRSTRVVYMGDGVGYAASNIIVPQIANYVYVRDTLDSGRFSMVLNRGRVSPTFNLPVILGYLDEEPEEEQVLGIHSAGLGQGTVLGDIITVGPHRRQHQFGGGDEVFIDPRLFLPGLVHPTDPASMQVKISPFIYYHTSWATFAGATSIDLTSFRPSLGALGRFCLVAFDPVIQEITYHFGPEFAVVEGSLITDFSYVPGPGTYEYPLGILFLVGGQSRLDWGYVSNNITDGRLFIQSPTASLLSRLDQLEGSTGNDPSLPACGAQGNAVPNLENTLDSLIDVAVSSPTDGQSLVYQSSTDRWVPGTPAGGGVALYTLGASDVSGASGIGVSASAAPGDHVHRGLQSLNASGNAPVYGPAYLKEGANITLTQSGASITIIGAAGASGGLSSINVPNNPPLNGPTYVVAGTNISLSQANASITITGTGAAGTTNILMVHVFS